MVLVKTPTLSKDQAQTILHGFLQQFQNICNKHTKPNPTEFEKFLSRNFKISSNGKVVGKNLNEYLERIQKFQERYTHIEIPHKLLEEPVIADNRAVFFYNVHLTRKDGGKVKMFLMAIGVFEDGKIVQWNQVAHQEGSTDWDH